MKILQRIFQFSLLALMILLLLISSTTGASIFDYEGFSMRFVFMVLALGGVIYERFNNSKLALETETAKVENKQSPFLKYAFFTLLGIVGLFSIFDKRGNVFKPYLPLASIEVVEIEGTLSEENTAHIWRSKKDGTDFHLNARKVYLEEYPEYSFQYVRTKKLPDKILNLSNDELKLEKDSTVKIKIRKKDLERMQSNEPERRILGISFGNKREKKYYALSYEGKTIYEKEYLK